MFHGIGMGYGVKRSTVYHGMIGYMYVRTYIPGLVLCNRSWLEPRMRGEVEPRKESRTHCSLYAGGP